MTVGSSALRSRSPSLKRSADEAELPGEAGGSNSNQDGEQWTDVVKKHQGRKSRSPRPHQVGTSSVNITGGEAAPYNVVIGNTHPDSTSEMSSDVLKKVAEQIPPEESLKDPLLILDIECCS